jgi:hypothetical protein
VGADRGEPLLLTVRAMPIVLPLVAFWWLDGGAVPGNVHAKAMLLAAVAVTSQLALLPFSLWLYFFYIAPIGMIATVALMRSRPFGAPAAAFWTAMLLAAGLGPAVERGLVPAPLRAWSDWHALPLRRAGLEVDALDSVRYGRMASFLASRPAGPIFVLGGHPELTFLMERPNASRVIYDGLADSATFSPGRLRRMLDSADVQTVVVVDNPVYARDSLQRALLREVFPRATLIGPFELRERTAGAAPPAQGPPARRPR